MEWLTAGNGFVIRVGLYLLIFWPTVGYVVYQDTRKRDLSKPKLRATAYGFFGVVGLFLYLTLKERAKGNSQ